MADPLYESIKAKPDDWDLRLVYADWLEDKEQYILANGQRWQALNNKEPRDFTGAGVTTRPIVWHAEGYSKSDVPARVFAYLSFKDPVYPFSDYNTHEEADSDLAWALYRAEICVTREDLQCHTQSHLLEKCPANPEHPSRTS